jgi:putative ABC transport system permease protein
MNLRLALKLARRELRGGFAGFRIFFMCFVLGSTAIAGVGSLSDAFLTGLQDQGQILLGGDVSVRQIHRPVTDEERKFFESQGRVSQAVSMRAMVYARDTGGRQLVELKAVDERWPLFGAPEFTPAQKLPDVLACEEDGVCGLAAEQTLLDRLKVARGDLVTLGNATFRVMAVLDKEPDRVSTGFELGPRLLISSKGLPATGLVTTESMVNYTYRIALKDAAGSQVQARAAIAGFKDRTAERFPDAGWNIRDRTDAAPGIRRYVEQLTMFLTLVGLVVLGVGGVGAGQAITAFLDRKRADIAILKSMGASGGFVFLTFFLQVMTVALAATVLGAALGAALPLAIIWLYGSALPVPPSVSFYPAPLLLALAFGSAVGGGVCGTAAEPRPRGAARQPVSRRGVARQSRRPEFLSRHFRRRRHRNRGADAGDGAAPALRGAVSGRLGGGAGIAAAAGGRPAPRHPRLAAPEIAGSCGWPSPIWCAPAPPPAASSPRWAWA